LARTAEDKGLTPNYIIPNMNEWELFPREAVAVGQQAIKEGGARQKLSRQEAFERAEALIKRAREQTFSLMKSGFISKAPLVD
jgi:malate dehydrogenase (oxaloacetate-decarboxylating)